jgi:hypothetical protein
LKNQPQPSTAIGHTVQNVDITKATFIPTKHVLVEKALLGLIRLDAVIPQMLDVAVFLPLIIPFELLPTILATSQPPAIDGASLTSTDPLRHHEMSHVVSPVGRVSEA